MARTCCETHPTLIRVKTTYIHPHQSENYIIYIHTLVIIYVCNIRVGTTTVTCTRPMHM